MELTIFELSGCPYCAQERRIIAELVREHPEYGKITIRRIDEAKDRVLADQYDYYYVPSIFRGKEKLYEADPSWSRAEAKEKIEAVLRESLAHEIL